MPSFRTTAGDSASVVVKLTISPRPTMAMIARIGSHPSIEQIVLTDGETVTVVVNGIFTEESLGRLCRSLKEWCSE